MITVRDMSKNDEIWTPKSALLPIVPYLPEHWIYWEMCLGAGHLAQHMIEEGFDLASIEGDTLEKEPMSWDAILTNPPWSKKHLFLQRSVKLGRPFALLLPVRTLGVRRCQIWLDDVDVLFIAKRVDFTGGGSPYEACAWFTKGLLPGRIVFE